ncbi:hypothetical protein [Candidatus Neomicrothrix sp.]|uniref:hypothetical protein n=1 Tax=Candidatus Neomicrothrix sp. TaxID=2719034 RepID=UPI001B74FCB4|nr:hypothetical protein [Candidatus Microthrix sp.]MBP6136580.1 hypothetical protein [Candidatus Microthrix sp.]MBP6151597.1 hypothetical protein [Candidatus Microthrix sp.]
MAGPAIEVEGLREVRAALKAAGVGLDDLKAAGKAGAELVAATARTTVPVLSGALQRSIRPAGLVSGGVVRAGTATVPYAAVIHFGSPARNIEPRPFLYDAVDRRANEVADAYERAVNKILEDEDL